MRTTIDLPDELFQELKMAAAIRGKSLKSIIKTAVEEEIRRPEKKPVRRLKFPLLSSKQPGVLNLTSAEIEDLLT